MSNLSENIVEIFSSIQGEGAYIGYRQIFIRFSGCNLSCMYCDTVHDAMDEFSVTMDPNEEILEFKNPLKVEDLTDIIRKFDLNAHQSISLTGGEPLLYSEYILEFLKQLKEFSSIKILLETNGILPDNLEKIINYTDIISMDVKLPSTTGLKPFWDKHRAFIEIAKKYNKEIYAKVVVSNLTKLKELQIMSDKIANFDIPLIIQPISTLDSEEVISSEKLLTLQLELLKSFKDVRVIPQTHKFLNIQ